MKQNNQSSWAARLRKLSALCLMLLASANLWAVDKLTIKPTIKAGDTGTIAISLDNETAYTAFQMEIILPKGLTIAKTGAMSIDSKRTADHQVLYNQLESGVIRVAAFSFNETAKTGNEAFTGNSGDLLLIEVTAASDYETGEVEVNEILFVKQSDLTAVNTVTAGYQMGDVDMNGKVDTNDAILVIKYFLDMNPEGFNVAFADVTGDNKIDTNDAVAIITIFLNN